MDLIVRLPWLNSVNAIWVVLDRLSKMRHLKPCKDNIDAVGLADQFIRHIASKHRLPNNILSDRGIQFASIFWNRLTKRWGVE